MKSLGGSTKSFTTPQWGLLPADGSPSTASASESDSSSACLWLKFWSVLCLKTLPKLLGKVFAALNFIRYDIPTEIRWDIPNEIIQGLLQDSYCKIGNFDIFCFALISHNESPLSVFPQHPFLLFDSPCIISLGTSYLISLGILSAKAVYC